MAALGARTLLVLDPRIVEGILGGLFLLMIPARRWLFARGMRVKAWHLTIVGAGIGFLSGMVASTGPINTPFFLAYGLVKGAYLATEALGSMAIGITKAIVFQRFDALPLETVGRGLIIGASLMVGSRLAKGFVLRLDAEQFRLLMDLLLAGAGWCCCGGRLHCRIEPCPSRAPALSATLQRKTLSAKQQTMRTDSKLSASLHLIKTAMIEKKMTQAELADAADCHEKTIQNLLSGRPCAIRRCSTCAWFWASISTS